MRHTDQGGGFKTFLKMQTLRLEKSDMNPIEEEVKGRDGDKRGTKKKLHFKFSGFVRTCSWQF